MAGRRAVTQIRIAMLRGGAAVRQIVGAAPPVVFVVIQAGMSSQGPLQDCNDTGRGSSDTE